MRVFLLLLTTIFFSDLSAQFDISGTIKTENGEPLISASIFLRDSEYATVSDEQGRWMLKDVEAGVYDLKASYLGFDSFEESLDVIDDYDMDIVMSGSPFKIDQIEIKATQVEANAPFCPF